MQTRVNKNVTLSPLQPDDREQFIIDNQRAFRYGATEEFGLRDDHFEEDGEIISRATIEASIEGENAEAYRVLLDGKKVGGAVISVEGEGGELELLFVNPEVHSKGIGYSAWCLIEQLHPEVTVWETHTPYFEKRNIHFYVNRCGFHIVEYFNSRHPDANDPDSGDPDNDGMFRFQKRVRNLKSAVSHNSKANQRGES
ncbi:MAG: N-acetyltransferase [Bacteroidales bacterium]|nr:N-acetyltransferase [Bacteroidales bacterium]